MNETTGAADAARLEQLAAEALDDADLALLDDLAQMYADVDPVPADLVERVRFAVALEEVYAEVAHITRVPADLLATRDDAATRTETLTFSAESLSAMVTVSREGARLRLDGWLTPSQVTRVRVRMQDAVEEVLSDETGRFVVRGLPEGFAQLSFHRPDGDEGDAVVTPLFQL